MQSLQRRRRKGLSEIVSTVLLVSLTIILSTIVLAFATTALGSSSINVSNLVGGANNSLNTQLAIEQVTFPTTSTASYLVITLTNTQNTATPSPFQQQVTINPSLYTSLESADLGNIRFFASFSNSVFSGPIYSWLESISSAPGNTANSATFWLNVAGGIGANSRISIYMEFLPVGTEFDGVFSGEAPQLSTSYGQYDNGGNVFSVYGGATWTGFSLEGGGTWSTTNGYLQQTSSSGGGNQGGSSYVYTGATYSATGSYILESLLNYPSVSSGNNPRVGLIAVSTATSGDIFGYRFIFQQSNNGAGAISFLNDQKAWVVNNAYQTSTSTNYVLSVSDSAGTWSGTLYQGNSVTSSSVATLSSTAYSTTNFQGNSFGYVGISSAVYTGSTTEANPVNVYWLRVRALPPNGAMPTTGVGSLQQSIQTGANLYVRNVGQSQALISAIYVNNVSTSAVINSTQYTPTIAINPGSFAIIHLQLATKYGSTYNFVIVSSNGYEVGINAQA
jgi:hypothetical protein